MAPEQTLAAGSPEHAGGARGLGDAIRERVDRQVIAISGHSVLIEGLKGRNMRRSAHGEGLLRLASRACGFVLRLMSFRTQQTLPGSQTHIESWGREGQALDGPGIGPCTLWCRQWCHSSCCPGDAKPQGGCDVHAHNYKHIDSIGPQLDRQLEAIAAGAAAFGPPGAAVRKQG